MIITVFGATGQVGKYIVTKALAQGHQVRAFGRNVTSLMDEADRNPNLKAIKGYVFEERDVFEAVNGADAVLSVLGGSFDGTDKTRSLGIKNIVTQMEKTGVKRIIAVGGLGILPDEKHEYRIYRHDYPKEYLPVGEEHLHAYLNLKQSSLEWTFLCCPDIKDNPGNDQYVAAKEKIPTPNLNKISAGNIAFFMLAELKQNNYIKHRVGISDSAE
jgi:uncharacterized protein